MFRSLKSIMLTTPLVVVVLLGIAACGGKIAAPAAASQATPTKAVAPAAAQPTATTAMAEPTVVPTPTAAAATAVAEAASMEMMLESGKDAKLGEFLTDSQGMTLYIYTPDKPGESTCYGGCAQAWPPLLVNDENEKVTLPAGFDGKIGVTKRTDDTLQVTYNDMPLYYYVKDTKPGDVVGQGVKDVWFVISPAMGSAMQPGMEEMMLESGKDAKLGEFLTDSQGMTLYIYTPDKPGESTCYGGCAQAWPPLLVNDENEKVTLPAGFDGKIGVTKRTDDTLQVTYNDMPLYYYVKDTKPGDVVGQGVKDVWFVISPGASGTGS